MNRFHLFLTVFLFPIFTFAQTPELIKNIAPSSESSEPQNFTHLNNTIFFIAKDDGTTFKLYRSDGTETGTELLGDLAPNNNGTNFSQPSSNFVRIGDFLYYLTIQISNGATEYERKLFRVGETGAPQLIATFDQEFFRSVNLVNIGNDLYWLAEGYQLWKSDGTSAGTELIYQTDDNVLEQLENIIVIGNEVVFTKRIRQRVLGFLDDEIEIWKSDGTSSGTQFYEKIIGDGLPNDCGGHQVSFFDFNGALGYFLDGSSMCGYESSMIIEGYAPYSINHVPASGLYISDPILKDGKVHFLATDFTNNRLETDLRILDGNQAPSISNFDEAIQKMFLLPNGTFLLAAWRNVWTSDGTAAGTKQILNFENGPQATNFIPYGNGYIFFATNDTNGNAIWFTDGTVSGSRQLADFPTSSQVFPYNAIGEAIIVGDILYFNGNTGFEGEELYKLDLSQIPPEPVCNNNLLTNPSFEDGFNGWTSTQSATISQDANSGNNAALLADGGVRMYQFVAAEPNKEYVISGRAKSDGYVNTYMKFLTADWQPTGRGRSQLLEGNYEYFEQTFTAPTDAAWIEVSFTASDGDLLIDDLCLSANGGTPPCAITTTVSNIRCDDEGTSDDPTDDTFSFSLLVEGTNANNIFRITDYAPNPGLLRDYGTTLNFEDLPISGGDFTLSIEDGFDTSCTTSVSVTPPATCSNPPNGDGDLVLFATGDPTIAQWSDGTALFEVTNQSGETFENIQVTFGFDSNIRLVGGNEYTSSAGTTLEQSWTRNPVWNIGTMGAGNVKTISLNVYSVTNSPMEIYAQISQATGFDVTSTPGNGTPPVPNEDDEVLWTINDGAPQGLPDLGIASVTTNGSTTTPGDIFTYSIAASNIGVEDAPGNFTIKSYISTDQVISSDDIQDGTIQTGNFAAGILISDIPGATTIPANLPQGDYYLIIKIDADDEVAESNETNNQISPLFTVSAPMDKPDLEFIDLDIANSDPKAGDILSYEIDLQNNGPGAAPDDFTIKAYISTDQVISSDDIQGGTITTGNFTPYQATYGLTGTTTLPTDLPQGDYQLILKVDADDQIAEGDETNNLISRPFVIRNINPTPPCPGNLLTNPGFESGFQGWESIGIGSGSFTRDAYSGHSALRISSDEAIGFEQTLPAEPGSIYRLTFWGKKIGSPQATGLVNGVPNGQGQALPVEETSEFREYSGEARMAISPPNDNLQVLFTKAAGTGVLIVDDVCLQNLGAPGMGVDLALSYQSLTGPPPAQWSFFSSTLTLQNSGTENATGIEIELKAPDEIVYKGGDEYNASQGTFQHWGDEIWRVGDLAAGNSVSITINYFRLSANGFTNFAQVSAVDQSDSDSTPGNGNCCTANEDDEAVIQIGTSANSVGNRAAVAEYLGNEVFAIIGANPNPTSGRFNIEVYSNENQTSEITIVDILGRPIFRKEVNLNEGHNSIPIELENEGTGMMVVKMTPFHPYLRQIRIMKVRD